MQTKLSIGKLLVSLLAAVASGQKEGGGGFVGAHVALFFMAIAFCVAAAVSWDRILDLDLDDEGTVLVGNGLSRKAR